MRRTLGVGQLLSRRGRLTGRRRLGADKSGSVAVRPPSDRDLTFTVTKSRFLQGNYYKPNVASVSLGFAGLPDGRARATTTDRNAVRLVRTISPRFAPTI